MKIQFHRIDTNVVVGLLVREFCCSGTDVSAKVLAMYAGTRTPSMEPQWLAAGLSQAATVLQEGVQPIVILTKVDCAFPICSLLYCNHFSLLRYFTTVFSFM